jgi:hypothetical protein
MILTASTKPINGPCAILYFPIKNIVYKVREFRTTVVSLVEENKKLDKVRGNVPDPETQLPVTLILPKKIIL